MRLTTRKHSSVKDVSRQKKKARIRKKVNGASARPRLCVFRSSKHIYAQLIDDVSGQTIVAASTLDVDGAKNANKDSATAIGKEIAKRAQSKNIKSVVFDRNGYLYHGRVKALAEGAREAGLQF